MYCNYLGYSYFSLLTPLALRLKSNEKLEAKYKDHSLTGNWKGYRDCHIEPDWLLLYKITATNLFLVRTGSHSDLFE